MSFFIRSSLGSWIAPQIKKSELIWSWKNTWPSLRHNILCTSIILAGCKLCSFLALFSRFHSYGSMDKISPVPSLVPQFFFFEWLSILFSLIDFFQYIYG
jgi:hypothetical protein